MDLRPVIPVRKVEGEVNEEMNIATQYNGDFDLQFLRPGEQVRAAGESPHAVEIFSRGRWMRVEKGDWLIRATDGRLVNRKFI